MERGVPGGNYREERRKPGEPSTPPRRFPRDIFDDPFLGLHLRVIAADPSAGSGRAPKATTP
jgi:hypothetical protein